MIDIQQQVVQLLEQRGVPAERLAMLTDQLRQQTHVPGHALRQIFQEGLLNEGDYQQLLGRALSVPYRSQIALGEIHPRFVEMIPIGYARRYHLIGLKGAGDRITVATHDLDHLGIVDHVCLRLGIPAVVELAPSAVIERAINQAYSEQSADVGGVIDEVSSEEEVLDGLVQTESGDLLDNASRAPVIKLVNMILFEAVKRAASDVHIQPFENYVQVRYRIDGVLYDYVQVPRPLLDEVVSRIKVVGKMDIAEKRIAQDGRTTVTVGERVVDLRISIIPTSAGERVVLRLLDKSARLYELQELGMSIVDQSLYEQLIQRAHGIVLVTGPTGSGKSTTLYAALQYLDCKELNILTLEDPIEYQLPGISQMQVSHKKGMTFATGLRAVLRQDPDIIMVGEIRDEETARMAVQSSLTGHLVFSTLHTNDAAGAVTRLIDLGIEPYLVASSLIAVLAQRLVRILCPSCSQATTITQHEIDLYQLDRSLLGKKIKKAVGCEACAMTGYRGRKGIFELLVVDEAIRELIVNRSKTSAIKAQAAANGMTSLRQDGIRKFLACETTIDEVSRITYQDEILMGSES